MFFRGNIHRDMLGMAPGDIFWDVVGFFMGSFIGYRSHPVAGHLAGWKVIQPSSSWGFPREPRLTPKNVSICMGWATDTCPHISTYPLILILIYFDCVYT